MMHLCRFLASSVIVVLASLSIATKAHADQSSRSWTARDSVAVRYFVTNFTNPGNSHAKELDPLPFRFSPDDEYFFFQFFYGDAFSDRMVYELWVYSVADVQHALVNGVDEADGLAPRRKIVMRSGFPGSYSGAAIYLPQWESDRTITFVGTSDRQARQVYRYDIESGALIALSDSKYLLSEDGGRNYWIRGSSLLFETDAKEPQGMAKYPVADIGSRVLMDIFNPHEFLAFHASYKGTAPKLVAEAEFEGRYGPWISPDEQWAFMLYSPKNSDRPLGWENYTFRVPAVRFMLINLQTGSSQPVLTSPAGPRAFVFKPGPDEIWGEPYAAFWSADSKHALLFNIALPLDTNAPERRGVSYVVDYEVDTNRWSIVDRFPLEKYASADTPRWVEEGKALAVTYRDEKSKSQLCKTFRFIENRWMADNHCAKVRAKSPEIASSLKLSLRETVNDPPTIIASDGKREIRLTGADPALDGVWRASAEAIDWHDSKGQPVESLLMLPREFSKEKPVRLVIQLSDGGNPADMFWPDGEVGTGFAAQSLVAQGFAVLQVEPAGMHRSRFIDPTLEMTPIEAPAQVRRIDEAIDMLRQRGIVINGPIGLIGFSRSGYYAYYIVTHPGRTRVGAAIAFDSISYGYGELVNGVALEGPQGWVHDQQYGGSFWKNKQAWLDAPAFNLDKLKTPILFCVAGPEGVDRALTVAETLGAFRLAKRPFDYQWYPDGPHPLVSARQREAALQSSVDWMNFWLRGHEREGPSDLERFARWRKVKSDWEKVQAEEAGKSGTAGTL